MLLPVITSPPARPIQARLHNAIGKDIEFLAAIDAIIHFLTGDMTINAIASQFSQVMNGMAWYQAKGCENQIASCAARISDASFHLLNKASPLITAAIVGLRKVSTPIEVAGLTDGAKNP